MIVMASLGSISLATVGTGEGGTVYLTGWLPTAPLVVLITHEAGEGSPTTLGIQARNQVSNDPGSQSLNTPLQPGPTLTSWGQRSRPICFSTFRSLSRSSCSPPSEASASVGWRQSKPQTWCQPGVRAIDPKSGTEVSSHGWTGS